MLLGNNEQKADKLRGKKYVFTINNYTDSIVDHLKKYLDTESVKYIFGFEVGEAGTPHIQGYVEFKNQRFRSAIKKGVGHDFYLKVAKGTFKENFDYTSKEGKIITKGVCLRSLLYKGPIITLVKWQTDLLLILDSEPDDRDIHWLWEAEGGFGKTTFAKWLYHNREGVMAIAGKSNDVKNGVLSYVEKQGRFPQIIIIDIPRSMLEVINYGVMEEVKNMFFFSGKYEGGMISGPRPHVLIFANEEPNYGKMSLDKWKVENLRKDDSEINEYIY